jgi:hypothetical protein
MKSPPDSERKTVVQCLYRAYKAVLYEFAILKESAVKGETAKTTTTEP